MKYHRKSLDELEKELCKPGPSMLETPPISVTLEKQSGIPLKKRETLSLNGAWEAAWGQTEEESLSGKPWKSAISANIPCSVHTALFEAGVIPDPMIGLQDKIAREFCYKTWWF